MEKFNHTLHGYDPIEVNNFLDSVISQVEKIIAADKRKDAKIAELTETLKGVDQLKSKLDQYERMESTLNKAILMAQKTSEQMKLTASREGDLIMENAKRNANRIVNDALVKADETDREAAMLRRNINQYKRKLKDVIQEQLDMVDDIEKIDF